MQFISTRSGGAPVSFKEAVLRCLPSEGGLYVPTSNVDLRQFFLYMDESTTYPELVATVAPPLLEGEFNPFSAARVAESAFVFEPVVRRLDDNLSVLELHNGPTGVFKDFGLAFLAAVMEELLKKSGRAMTLTATTGGTGDQRRPRVRGPQRHHLRHPVPARRHPRAGSVHFRPGRRQHPARQDRRFLRRLPASHPRSVFRSPVRRAVRPDQREHHQRRAPPAPGVLFPVRVPQAQAERQRRFRLQHSLRQFRQSAGRSIRLEIRDAHPRLHSRDELELGGQRLPARRGIRPA